MWIMRESYFGGEMPTAIDVDEQRLHQYGRRAREEHQRFLEGHVRRVLDPYVKPLLVAE